MGRRKKSASDVKTVVRWECQVHKVAEGGRCWQCKDQLELFSTEEVTELQRKGRR